MVLDGGTAGASLLLSAPQRPELTIVGTSLPEGPSWWWLLGLSGTTPLEITVRNDGAAPAVDPPVSLSAGPEGVPGATVTPPELGTIQPGEQRTFRVEVPLEAPVFGTFEVSGTIQDAAVRTGDSIYPLGLLALLAVPLHLTTAWIVFSTGVPPSADRPSARAAGEPASAPPARPVASRLR
ncbi:hypothetical protein HD597_004573 [Nonomuraea thailandensis]|uniref:Alpha-galactosidase NEW3 domain-containing protein n=1 Tax=Nonomuraea thailandensis TaxID=1188745 RepID=A0A9X2GNI1_9ACTN|nr:hypothetical protein [Nonomuraea thailandensis]MCP2357553.1 hypothetical protein [Nonomuraea thailandensis]